MAGGGSGRGLRVAFLGNAAWSVPALEALAGSRHRPVLVGTRRPRPAGRGGRPTPTPVAEAARRLGLHLVEVDTVRDGPGFDALAGSSPDLLAVVAYGEVLPRAVLDIARVAPVNVHFSLLPDLRGAAPVQRAILEGRPETGVTIMRLEEGLDTGAILLAEATPIADTDEDAGALGARLAAMGGALLVRAADGLAAGTLEARPQDEALASWAPKLTRDEERIDWTEPAAAIVRRVRALAPSPGAWTSFRGRRLKVYRAEVQRVGWTGGWPTAGTLLVLDGWPAAHTVDGGALVLLREVGPEGRRRMSGQDFARGSRPRPGERLGG